jgi:hypothetical protein
MAARRSAPSPGLSVRTGTGVGRFSTAADAAGDTVAQTVYDAYGLKHSGGR